MCSNDIYSWKIMIIVHASCQSFCWMMLFKRLMLVLAWLVVLGIDWTAHSVTAQVEVELSGTTYTTNNTVLLLDEIVEDTNPLICRTDLSPCCRNPFVGEWFFSNGTTIRARTESTDGWYSTRSSDREVFLHRRPQTTTILDYYCCVIPTASNTDSTVCVFLNRILIDTNSPIGVVEGQRLELSCSQEADPGPDITSITWSDNSGPLSSTAGVLTIDPVTSGDAGTYTCTIDFGTNMLTETYQLSPTPITVMVSGGGNDFAVEDSTTLNCVVSGADILDSPTVNYVWRRENNIIQGEVESSLMLDPLTTNDIGSYTCSVSISHNLLSIPVNIDSEGLQINVVAPPVLSTPTAVAATTLSLSWTQSGSAVDSYTVSYTYTIRRCGSGPISASVVGISGISRSVMLDSLEEDSDYSITLTANRGSIQVDSNVVMATTSTAAPIGPPSSLDVNVAKTLTSITVQWGEVPCADRNGEITGYIVEYSSTSPSHSGTLTVSGADTRTAVLGGLLPSTTYTITVRAQGAPTTVSASDVRATTRPTKLGFFQGGNFLPLNSIVLLSDIGLDSEALFCLTPSTDCCTSRGAWRFPNGDSVTESTSSDLYFSRGNRILLLHRMSDVTGPTGIYTCLVPTSSASNSPALPHYVGVYGSAEEVSLSTDELVFDPSSHTVSCVSSGGPVNTVTWNRNGDLITSSTLPYQLSQRLTSGETSTFLHNLTITGGDAEDYNGTFSCAVSNSRGPAPVQSLDIHNILITGNERPHDLSSTVNITCSSDLAVQTIRWLDGEGQELTNNVGQQQLVLTIEEVREELNNTMYRCEVTVLLANGLNALMEDTIFVVRHPLAPRRPVLLMSYSITTSSAIIQWMVLESFTELPVNFRVLYGLSPEDLSQRSPVVTATSGSQTYSIQLNSLATGTEYYYRVSSRNEFSTVLSDIGSFMTDDSQSGPVSALELNSTSDMTLLISWGEPVRPNGNILSYSITITDLRDDSTVRSENRGAEETTSFMETNLVPGVPYNVSIAAVNRAGLGTINVMILFTRELAPSTSPMNVRAIRTTATVMIVSWRPLTLAEARGFISHYTVTYSPQIISGGRKKQAAMKEVVLGMDTNAVTIDGLDPDTVYNIHVSATTGGGDGAISVVISVPQADLGSSVDVGPIVGGVVAVVLILTIAAVLIAVVVVVRGKRTQKENIATKDFEEAKYYDTIDEGPAYEPVGEGRSKTSGSDVPLSKAGEFHIKECPAYGPAPTGHATTNAGDSQEYEVIRDPRRKAEVQQTLGGSKFVAAKVEQFSLEERPAHVPTPAVGDKGDTRDESTTALYEPVAPA